MPIMTTLHENPMRKRANSMKEFYVFARASCRTDEHWANTVTSRDAGMPIL